MSASRLSELPLACLTNVDNTIIPPTHTPHYQQRQMLSAGSSSECTGTNLSLGQSNMSLVADASGTDADAGRWAGKPAAAGRPTPQYSEPLLLPVVIQAGERQRPRQRGRGPAMSTHSLMRHGCREWHTAAGCHLWCHPPAAPSPLHTSPGTITAASNTPTLAGVNPASTTGGLH